MQLSEKISYAYLKRSPKKDIQYETTENLMAEVPTAIVIDGGQDNSKYHTKLIIQGKSPLQLLVLLIFIHLVF